MANLEGFLASLDNPTRADNPRRIGSVEVVRNRNLATRSIAVSDADSLIYVVNFEDEQGFAYLAADDRISSSVIYVADSGNISTMNFGNTFPLEGTRTIYPEYPTSGPGVFYDDNVSPGELFMNPNTFTLFNDEEEEYYVGDFFPNGMKEFNDSISFINNLTLNFINVDLNNNDESIYQEIPFIETPSPSEPPIIVESTSIRDTVVLVNRLLEDLYHWNQDYPFNKYCPIVTHWITREAETASAGCVSLAIAKIMAYHRYPQILKYNNFQILWEKIINELDTQLGEISAGLLTKGIRDNCFTLYFFTGTFTLPSSAAKYLKNKSYNNVSFCNYEDDIVKNMLDNGCPIFMCSLPSGTIIEQLQGSHGWNLDGYLMETKTITSKYYQNNILISTVERKETNFMVHCDWGWSGTFNGYFTSGVFDLGDDNAYFDNIYHSGINDTYYKWYNKIITYDKPL